MEENTSYGRNRRIRKEVVVCIQAMVGNDKFLVQFLYGHNKEMSSASL